MKTDESFSTEKTSVEVTDLVNTSELITDYSFQYRIVQLNNILDFDYNNSGFCLET